MGPGMMHGGAGPTPFDPARIETLKTELGITAAQEPAWTKYAKTLQDAATAMKTTREGIDPDTVSKMSPQDRFAFVTKIREQAQKQFEAVKTAAERAARHARRHAEGQGPGRPSRGSRSARARMHAAAWAARSTGIEAGNGAVWRSQSSQSPLDASNVQRALTATRASGINPLLRRSLHVPSSDHSPGARRCCCRVRARRPGPRRPAAIGTQRRRPRIPPDPDADRCA